MEAYNLLDEHSKDSTFYSDLFEELSYYEFDNSFVVTRCDREKLPKTKKKPILFLTGDKSHQSDPWNFLDYAELVFKNYGPFQPTHRIIPFPLNRKFTHKYIPISERPIDYCFIGNGQNREYIRGILLNYHEPSSFIQYNNGNGDYVEYNKYCEILANSKICICMPGISLETLRYTEAAAAGCIIVSNKLPNFWYYKNKYEFQIPDWRLLPELLDRVRNHPVSELDMVGLSTRKYYEEFLSPKALALHVKDFIYNHKLQSKNNSKIIFDVGCCDGSSWMKEARDNPYNKVFGFEPTPELCEKIKLNKPENYILNQVAISDYNGKSKFQIAGQCNWGCSSLLEFSDKSQKYWDGRTDFKVTETIETDVIRLDKFIEENNIDKIDYLHVDTQGSDLKVLKGLGKYLDIVKEGVIEAGSEPNILYDGQNDICESIKFLRSNGFKIKNVIAGDHLFNEFNIYYEKNTLHKKLSEIRECDEIYWPTYTNLHNKELSDLVQNDYKLLADNYYFDETGVVFTDKLHPNWMELYNQIFELNPESVYECGCGTGQHLINIRKINSKVKLGGCDYSEEQLHLGCKRFNLDSYDFIDNLGVCDFSIPGECNKISQYELVYAHAVVMHLSTTNSINFLKNMKELSTKYILLIDTKYIGYDGIIEEIFPISEYKRLTDFKYIDSNLCTLLEKI